MQIKVTSANGWKMPPQMTIRLDVHIDRRLPDTTPSFDMVVSLNDVEIFCQEFDKCIPEKGDAQYIIDQVSAQKHPANIENAESYLGEILTRGAIVECEFLSDDEQSKEDQTLMFYFYPREGGVAFDAVESVDSRLIHMIERYNQ